MPIFMALHILSMFTMVTLFIGSEVFYAGAFWQRDPRALAWVHRTVRQSRIAIGALGALIAGVAFGLLTAATGGLDFFEGWLLAAYVLVALFLVFSFVFGEGIIRLADKAVEADAGHGAVEDIASEMASSNRAVVLLAVNSTIFALIILDMVLKPF